VSASSIVKLVTVQVGDAARSFHPDSIPVFARQNFRRELIASIFLPFVLAGVDTGVVTVLVKKSFTPLVESGELSLAWLNIVVATVGAAKAFANITSFFWVRLSHGRPKIAFTVGLQWGMILIVCALAAIPRTPVGLVLFTAGVVAARMVWAGFVTIRSGVWRSNYSRATRARITGKTATAQVLMMSLLGVGLGWTMDHNPGAYRVLYPLGAVICLLGVYAWSRIRVRGQTRLLRLEREDEGVERPSFNPIGIARLLRADRLFRSYMILMFVLGSGNLMAPPLIAIVLEERFALNYLPAMLITHSIPLGVMPFAIPFWAKLLDHVHVIRFRVIHAWFFVGAHLLFFGATMSGEAWILFVAAAVQGAAFAGGALAWTLGHHDFAPAHRAGQYMGVHVTLTGVRGLIAPFVGVALYGLFKRFGGEPAAGAYVFLICAAMTSVGGVGFIRLARTLGARDVNRHGGIETTPPTKAGS